MFLCICTCTIKQTNPLKKSTHTCTHTLSQDVSQRSVSSASVQCWTLQPQGEAPASSPAKAGQVEHLAPQKGHPHPHPSAPIILLGVKEASLPFAFHQASSSVNQRPAFFKLIHKRLQLIISSLGHVKGSYYHRWYLCYIVTIYVNTFIITTNF